MWEQDYIDNEFTLAKKTPTAVTKQKKLISVDRNTPYYKKNKITIKKYEEQLKEDLSKKNKAPSKNHEGKLKDELSESVKGYGKNLRDFLDAVKSGNKRPTSVASIENRSKIVEDKQSVSYTPYTKKSVQIIQSKKENSFENNGVKYSKNGRSSSVTTTPLKPSINVTAEEVEQTITGMLERFKAREEKKQKNLELIKLMKKEEEAAYLIFKPKILNKKFKLSDEDFLKRQENYKEQLDKKIRELKELQLQKKQEHEKADPSYGVRIEEQDIQEKIDWMMQWKEKIIKRNMERKKELAKKQLEECTFQPNIIRNSELIAENNPGKRMRVDRFNEGENRGKSAKRVRNKSAILERRPSNSKNSSHEVKEDAKHLKTDMREKKTKNVIKTDKPSIPTKNSKVYVPVLPGERGSKINAFHPDKKRSGANVVIKNGIFNDKEIDNLELMNIIHNKSHGGSDTPAGEISMKNKKLLPKLSDKDYELMQELFMKRMSMDNGNFQS